MSPKRYKPLSRPGLASLTMKALVALSAYLTAVKSTSSYITDTRTTSALYTYVPDDDDDDSSSFSTSLNGACVADDAVCQADPDCAACLSMSSRQGNSGQPCEVRYPEFFHSNASLCEQVAASYCCYYEDESTAEICLANVPTADYWNVRLGCRDWNNNCTCILTNLDIDCVIEDMPCYGGALVDAEPQTRAPSAIDETPFPTSTATVGSRTPPDGTLAPTTTAIVETRSPSTTTIAETLSPSTTAIVEIPVPSTTPIVETLSPSLSDRELPSASPRKIEPTSLPSITVEPSNLTGEPFAATYTPNAAPVATQSSALTVGITVSPSAEAPSSSRGASSVATQAPTLGESSDADDTATVANDASMLVAGAEALWKLVAFGWVLGICLAIVMH